MQSIGTVLRFPEIENYPKHQPLIAWIKFMAGVAEQKQEQDNEE